MTRRPAHPARPSRASSESLSPEALDAFVDIGSRLAAQMAEDAFHRITVDPDWSITDLEAATEEALDRAEVNARDMLAGRGDDPDCEQWGEIWSAMERQYRDRMAELIWAAEPRVRGAVQ